MARNPCHKRHPDLEKLCKVGDGIGKNIYIYFMRDPSRLDTRMLSFVSRGVGHLFTYISVRPWQESSNPTQPPEKF